MLDELELMKIQAEALFLHDNNGRLTQINEPIDQMAPRFFLGRTKKGNILRFRYDVSNKDVDEIQDLLAANRHEVSITRIINILEKSERINNLWIGPAYVFDKRAVHFSEAIRVTNDNKELLKVGFRNLLTELDSRQPCFMIIKDNIAVSVCFSSRITNRAAEAGIETLAAYRGNGFSLQVPTSWANEIYNGGRIPLYSTSWDNVSSQSVAKKLNLLQYGTDLSIY